MPGGSAPGLLKGHAGGPLLPRSEGGRFQLWREGGRGVRRKDERPAPLRGLSPLSLMLPLNHRHSSCELLWGGSCPSRLFVGERADFPEHHWETTRQDLPGGKRRSRVHGAPRPRLDRGSREPRTPPAQPWMTSSHRFKAVQPGEQIIGRGQSQSSAC